MADAKKRTSLHGSFALDRLRSVIYNRQLDEEETYLLRTFSECVVGERELRAATEPVFKTAAQKVWQAANVESKIKITTAEFQAAAQSLGYTNANIQRLFLLMDEAKRGAVAAKDFALKIRYWFERAQRELPDLPADEVVVPVREHTGLLGRIYNAGKYVESAQVILLAELEQLETRYVELSTSLQVEKEKSESLSNELARANVTITRLMLEADRTHEVTAELEKVRCSERWLEAMLAKERTSYERRLLEAEQRVVPQVPYAEDVATLELKCDRFAKEATEYQEALVAETRRCEMAEVSKGQAIAHVRICEDELADYALKEHALRMANASLEQKLEAATDILNKQRKQGRSVELDRPQLRPLKDVQYTKNVMRLEGILPRAVCMKAGRYPMEEVSLSSRLP